MERTITIAISDGGAVGVFRREDAYGYTTAKNINHAIALVRAAIEEEVKQVRADAVRTQGRASHFLDPIELTSQEDRS